MRKVDSASEVGIKDADFRHSVKNVSPGIFADGKLAADVQAFGNCCGNGVADDRENGRGAPLEELHDPRIHPQRHDTLGLHVGNGIDADRQFASTSSHADAERGRVVDGTVPRKVFLDEIHEDLNLRNTVDIGAVNLEINRRRGGDVRDDCGAVVSCAEELESGKVRE